MTKEQYLKEKSEIENVIKDLHQKNIEIQNKYIEANRQFKDGDPVVVIRKDKTENGFIDGAFINGFGEIKYDVLKQKKDGNPSLNKIWIWSDTKIERR